MHAKLICPIYKRYIPITPLHAPKALHPVWIPTSMRSAVQILEIIVRRAPQRRGAGSPARPLPTQGTYLSPHDTYHAETCTLRTFFP